MWILGNTCSIGSYFIARILRMKKRGVAMVILILTINMMILWMFVIPVQSTLRSTSRSGTFSEQSILRLANSRTCSTRTSTTDAFPQKPSDSEMAVNLVAVDFTVYGKVQGVFFRKHTMAKARELGLRGFCLNTPEGTVTGTVEGPNQNVKTMKTWLQKTGSPKSKILRTEFGQERSLSEFTFTSFQIQK